MPKLLQLFSVNFSNVYSVDSGGAFNFNLDLQSHVSLGSVVLTEQGILDAMLRLKTNKSRGPDNMPPSLYKNCANSLSRPITQIFNLSLKLGRFPTRWKCSSIAKISVLGKLFERMVCVVLTEEFKNYLSVNQHGFME